MPQIELVIIADNKPVNLPDPEAIVQQCRITRSRVTNFNSNSIRGVPLVDESCGGGAYAWVKYGRPIAMDEALTQDFLEQSFSSHANAAVRVPRVYLAFRSGSYGYIVMEYINGSTCDDSDATLVAAAVQSIIAVRGPTAEPGPVGGGPIEHRFFVDWKSPVTYDSVQALERYVNGILEFTGSKKRASFEPEVKAHGLCLCPCDMNRNNFMKDRLGRIVAIDFGASCFLPPSFAFALREGDNFAQLIAARIEHPVSTQIETILIASYALVRYNTNKIGLGALSPLAYVLL